MPHTSAVDRLDPRHRHDPGDRMEDPVRAFTNGILLAMPLWSIIGLLVWAII
jgi:hypothetical protein